MASRPARWQRLNDALDPKSPRDWPRFLLLTVLLLVVWLIVHVVINLITSGDVRSSSLRFGSVGVLAYILVGGAWWRVLFQYLDRHRHDPETEAADRRLRRRGSIIWIVLAYIVLFVEHIEVSLDSNGDDSGTSVVTIVVFLLLMLLLPLGLAWLTAVLGRYRYMAIRAPRRR